ncbi:hypothetical protein ZIOFF_040573 [Zingiber officinale]|uniref:Protein kinase domain-containing protein n=1 Tax=Zingiber officinale TaxID=94328 RepID=A0A8J5KVA9_ZINOF|nr:hypothetical protein ZIOFF_040573 [Zingiber officinale]
MIAPGGSSDREGARSEDGGVGLPVALSGAAEVELSPYSDGGRCVDAAAEPPDPVLWPQEDLSCRPIVLLNSGDLLPPSSFLVGADASRLPPAAPLLYLLSSSLPSSADARRKGLVHAWTLGHRRLVGAAASAWCASVCTFNVVPTERSRHRPSLASEVTSAYPLHHLLRSLTLMPSRSFASASSNIVVADAVPSIRWHLLPSRSSASASSSVAATSGGRRHHLQHLPAPPTAIVAPNGHCSDLWRPPSRRLQRQSPRVATTLRITEMAMLVDPPNGVRNHGKHYYFMWQTLFEIDTKYEPIKPIGRGAYGIVCSSINRETNEKVAIKKIHNVFDNRVDALRTLRELKLLRHLRHENVIALKDIMMPPHRRSFRDVYLVYELMDTDLHQIIKSSQALSNDHCQYFLFQVSILEKLNLCMLLKENQCY